MQDLCLEQQHSFVNDFGNQLEISAHSCFNKGQKSVCDMERTVCCALLCCFFLPLLKLLAVMHRQQQHKQSTKLQIIGRKLQNNCLTVSLLLAMG